MILYSSTDFAIHYCSSLFTIRIIAPSSNTTSSRMMFAFVEVDVNLFPHLVD